MTTIGNPNVITTAKAGKNTAEFVRPGLDVGPVSATCKSPMTKQVIYANISNGFLSKMTTAASDEKRTEKKKNVKNPSRPNLQPQRKLAVMAPPLLYARFSIFPRVPLVWYSLLFWATCTEVPH